jgi:uncharacterized membrane protein YhaH (DUF805 family)
MNMPWGKFFSPKDSKGRESRTLFFVSVTVSLIWIIIIAVTTSFVIQIPAITVTDLATAICSLGGLIVTLLGVWLGREWINNKTS